MPWRAKSSARCRNCSSVTWSAMKIRMHAIVESSVDAGVALLLEQGIDKLFGIERQQIAHLLAHANKSHGQAQFTRDGNYHSAFRGSIELSKNYPSDAGRLGEQPCLLQAILARR